MDNDQITPSTIFNLYGSVLSAQFAFARAIMGAYAKIYGGWQKLPQPSAVNEGASMGAAKP